MRVLRLTAVPVAVMLAGAVALAGCDDFGDGRRQNRTYEIQDKVTQLVLTGESMRVDVVPGDGPVRIEETRHWRSQQPRTTRVVEGTTLRVNQKGCGNFANGCEVRMTIKVPKDTGLDIDFAAGELTIDDIAGDLRLNVNAGDIDAKALAGARTVATVNTGRLSLRYSKAPTKVEAKVNAGEVEIRVPDDTGYAISSTGGLSDTEIDVRRDANSPHSISVKVDTGSAKVRKT